MERPKNLGVEMPVGESLTQQHFKNEVDINQITDRHLRGTPLGNPGATRELIFGDFSSALDYQAMCDQVLDAKQAFRRLPARLRARFENSEYQLLRFLENPENRQEGIHLGLLDDNSVLGQSELKLSDLPGKIAEAVTAALKSDEEANPVPVKKGRKADSPPSS